MNELIAIGRVESLCINGIPVETIDFDLRGPRGDSHAGFTRELSGHDGVYVRTSALTKGTIVFNWRSWTGLSKEELSEVQENIGKVIPVGCLLENIVFSGIPNFSKLAPTTRLVFPKRANDHQTVLAVWEENGPCRTVGQRLENYYSQLGLQKLLIDGAQNKRGVMGMVLSHGRVEVGDEVRVYPPAE